MYCGMVCPPCCEYRDQEKPTVPKKLIDMLVEAMKDERADRAKYKGMMDAARDQKVKRQVQFAYEDEGKHYKMFQQIYQQLTGKPIDIPLPEAKKPDNFLNAVETSIDGELGAVELYRDIRAMLPTRMMRDMLFEIITDEQEHAARFNYLFSLLK
jgi:rubrerythrin